MISLLDTKFGFVAFSEKRQSIKTIPFLILFLKNCACTAKLFGMQARFFLFALTLFAKCDSPRRRRNHAARACCVKKSAESRGVLRRTACSALFLLRAKHGAFRRRPSNETRQSRNCSGKVRDTNRFVSKIKVLAFRNSGMQALFLLWKFILRFLSDSSAAPV